jgi:hypothetical protein
MAAARAVVDLQNRMYLAGGQPQPPDGDRVMPMTDKQTQQAMAMNLEVYCLLLLELEGNPNQVFLRLAGRPGATSGRAWHDDRGLGAATHRHRDADLGGHRRQCLTEGEQAAKA